MGAGRAERFLVALTPSTDLILRAKYLLIAAMVGGALRADGLIADEANRLDATKAGIAVGQEQRQSDANRRGLREEVARQSGLGLAAQRQAVMNYLNGGPWRLVDEFTEVESSFAPCERKRIASGPWT